MRWAGHVAHMGRGTLYTGFWWGNVRERGHSEEEEGTAMITKACR